MFHGVVVLCLSFSPLLADVLVMTNYSEAQRQALRAFAETLERGELEETRDFESRRRPESFYDAPAARRDRPYYEGEFERYERLSRGLTHQPFEVNPRHAWPTYDRSESHVQDYSVSCFWSNCFLGFIFLCLQTEGGDNGRRGRGSSSRSYHERRMDMPEDRYGFPRSVLRFSRKP